MSGLRFDHIGIVVAQIARGRELLGGTLGLDQWTEVFEDHGIGVLVQFGRAAQGPCYELIAPLGEASPIAGALRGSRNILNHVAYLVDDLPGEAERLRSLGCHAAGPAMAALAYGGRQVQFWMSPLRFLLELVEAAEHEHVYHWTPDQHSVSYEVTPHELTPHEATPHEAIAREETGRGLHAG